ncbi:unnamed protein product [Cladocopium goreaui]|uniref:Uncharacterized protein n=1 Tax=Cladocopium goreaui TaxID=2562237 RepID=A0A9P1BLY5_9DINO|nr:unnamed protein product [Cladocopium goreaui]
MGSGLEQPTWLNSTITGRDDVDLSLHVARADSTTAIHIEISSWGVMGWVNSMCMVADGAKGTQEACCRHWPLVLSSRWMGTLVAPLIQPTTIAIKGSKQCNAQAVQGSEQRV